MAIEHEPPIGSEATHGLDDNLLEQIATAYELDAQTARVETFRQSGLFNMSAHCLWLGEAWATMLFTSSHIPQASGPIVNLTVNKEFPADAMKKLYVEDFFALPHSGHIKLRHDVLERDEAGQPWRQNAYSGPLLEIKVSPVEREGEVDVSAGLKYKNAIYSSDFLPNLNRGHNLTDAQRLVRYLGMLDEITCLETITRVSRRCAT